MTLWTLLWAKCLYFITVIIFLHQPSGQYATAKRLYVHQFPPEHEHLLMPPTVLFSIFMGKISYPHLPLLFESMKWNGPTVQFRIINIIPKGSDYSKDVLALRDSLQVSNLQIVSVSVEEWRDRVKDRLGIDVPFTMEWYYKMCDYKPMIAHLFPEHSGSEYKYWGFVDMDVVWGNFTKFAGWFQGQPFIISGWWRSTGAAQFFINEEWTRKFMFQDPLYIPLLANKTYHNLDEEGGQIEPKDIVDGGRHAISHYILGYSDSNHKPLNRGKDWQDHCFLDEGDSVTWAGPIRWFRGSLQIVHGSAIFPPGRELLFYHRPTKDFALPIKAKDAVFEDLMKYGYLLPNFIPLLSRTMCLGGSLTKTNSTLSALQQYKPYHDDCIEKYK